MAVAGPLPLTWSGRAEPKQIQGQLVTANYFEVLGLRPATGRFFLPDEDTKPGGNNVAVLSYSLWVNKFGSDPNIIGQVLTLNATQYTVIGVGPRGFKGTFTFGSAEEVWVPISMYTQVLAGFFKDNFNERRFLAITMFGRLKDGVTLPAAEASLKTVASQLETAFPKDNASRSVALTPLTDAVVGVNNHGQIALMGGLMMAVVGVVLLIACVNVANLLLAQAARREKEITLRAALGASRGRVIRQLFTESLVLAILAGIAGAVIGYLGRAALWSFRPPFLEQGDLDLGFDLNVLFFTLGRFSADRCADRYRPRVESGAAESCRSAERRGPRRQRELDSQSIPQHARSDRNRAGAGCVGGRRPVRAQHAKRATHRSGF